MKTKAEAINYAKDILKKYISKYPKMVVWVVGKYEVYHNLSGVVKPDYSGRKQTIVTL